MIIQIIQNVIVSDHLTQTKLLSKMMIKSNYNLSKHASTSTQKCRLYALVVLVKMIKAITTFILLLMMTMNLTSIDHAST